MEPTSDPADLLWGALRPLLARLHHLAQTDTTVRAELTQVAHALLALTAALDRAPSSAAVAPAMIPAAAHDAIDRKPPPNAVLSPAEVVPSLAAEQAAPVAAASPSLAPSAQPPLVAPAVERAAPAPPAMLQEQAPPPVAGSATAALVAMTPPPTAKAAGIPAPASPSVNPSTRRPPALKPRAAAPLAAHLRAVYVTPVGSFPAQAFQTQRADLETIATSCALKADAARWMRERQRLLNQGRSIPTELTAQKWKLIEHAQTLPECYLWMLHQEPAATVAPALYDNLGNCYEACAMIAGLLDKLMVNEQQSQPALFQALGLAALAQATLRNAIQLIEGTVDADQRKLYRWVEAAHSQYHLQMRRYTRRSKEAHPDVAATLVQQVYELIDKLNARRKRQNAQRRLWRTARTLAQALQAQTEPVTAAMWQPVEAAIVALVRDGVPPSSVELRTLLLPLLDLLPDAIEHAKPFSLVLREIDRFLAQDPEDELSAPSVAPNADVLRVQALLQGATIVFIGGERRLAAEAALCSAFGLQELIWLTGHDQTYTEFEPYVARTDVSVVILALRWSRHGFGQVKEYCDRYDKLFVRLLGGYNPNQVAHVILNQIGDRLEQRMMRKQEQQDNQVAP